MPLIMPIRDLRKTNEISMLAHKNKEPIFITKNGYSDLVVMSTEYFEKFASQNRIDQAIYEAEEEYARTGETIDIDTAFEKLDEKYNGKI